MRHATVSTTAGRSLRAGRTMKVAAITGPHSAAVVDRPEPQAGGDVVKVKILVAPACTEWRQYRDGDPGDVLGHEAAGVVADPGSSTLVRAGDRVVVMPQYGCGRCALCLAGEHIHCPNQRDVLAETGSEAGTATYAQYLLKPDWLLVPVPDDVQLDHAAMACCGLGPSFNAMERLRVDTLDTVLVSGCGPVGLGAVVNARVRGARTIALEPHPGRAALARELGAELVIDPRAEDVVDQVRAATGGHGADAAVETSGAPGASVVLEAATRVHGRLAFLNWEGTVVLEQMVPKAQEIHGCWHWNHLRDGVRMLAIIRRAAPLLDRMITHRFPLDDVGEAWEVQLDGNCGKVLLHPWDHAEEPSA
jgi:L-iditol 2-dehydrogenase